MALSFHDKFSRQFSAPHNYRHREKLNFIFSLFMVGVILTGSVIFKQAWNSFDENPSSKPKSSNQFTLYSTKSKIQSPWKFQFSSHHQKWMMAGVGDSPRFIFNGLYLQKETEVPRYFRYWVSQNELTDNENVQKESMDQWNSSSENFHSATIFLSDRPKSVLRQTENPSEHVVTVKFIRHNQQLKMLASPLEKETKAWKVLSWRIKKTRNFQTPEKNNYPSGRKLVLRVPQNKGHNFPRRAVSSH